MAIPHQLVDERQMEQEIKVLEDFVKALYVEINDLMIEKVSTVGFTPFNIFLETHCVL